MLAQSVSMCVYYVLGFLRMWWIRYDTIMFHKLTYNPLKRVNELRVSVGYASLLCSAFAMHVQCPKYCFFILLLPFVSAIFHYSRIQNLYHGYHHIMFGFVLCVPCMVVRCARTCMRAVCLPCDYTKLCTVFSAIGLGWNRERHYMPHTQFHA